jgi:hypothetical protein
MSRSFTIWCSTFQVRCLTSYFARRGRKLALGQFVHSFWGFADSADQNIMDAFADAHAFIDEAIAGGGKVLVHCMMGQSRSVSMVVSYMMRKEHITEEEALARIREQRSDAKPIDAFLKQLALYHRLGCAIDAEHPDVRELRKSTHAIPRTRSDPNVGDK